MTICEVSVSFDGLVKRERERERERGGEFLEAPDLGYRLLSMRELTRTCEKVGIHI